jgi:hypothetical protein
MVYNHFGKVKYGIVPYLQKWLFALICFFFYFVSCSLKEQGLGFRSIVNQLKTIIIAKLTIFRYEYYAHYRFNKVFVGSNFWKKKIHFLLCFKSWDVTWVRCKTHLHFFEWGNLRWPMILYALI